MDKKLAKDRAYILHNTIKARSDTKVAAQRCRAGVTLSPSDSLNALGTGESTAEFTYVDVTSRTYVGYWFMAPCSTIPRVGLLLRIFTGQLLPVASSLIQRPIQSNIRTPNTMAPQLGGNDADELSVRALPESTFIEILSAMRSLPPFFQCLSDYGQTPLHLADHLRSRQLVQQLIAHGVWLNAQDMYGFTALRYADLLPRVTESHHTVDLDLEVPQIVVIGSQSVGTSSSIEAILGVSPSI